MLRRDDVILVLGAGASFDADIPMSIGMIRELENLLSNDQAWSKYMELYNYVKSSILYSYGIKGEFEKSSWAFNIEQLFNTLEILSNREDEPLFPFIGSWNPKLSQLSGWNFEEIKSFRLKILTILKDKWVQLDHAEDAGYYKGLIEFQNEYQHALRIFSLNYDLCVEKNCSSGLHLQRGFSNDFKWDWRLFDDDENSATNIYLYKLHGSIDWTRNAEGSLVYTENSAGLEPHELDIIFGTTYKLRHTDPFLFYIFEFRKWSLESRLIIVIGYGFGDEHINGILSQALNSNPKRKILVVAPIGGGGQKATRIKRRKQELEQTLGLRHQNQVECVAETAKYFLSEMMNIEEISKFVPQDTSPIREI